MSEYDEHWREVMNLAEKYGFIVQCGSGAAVLATHENQIERYGQSGYKRIQFNNNSRKEALA